MNVFPRPATILRRLGGLPPLLLILIAGLALSLPILLFGPLPAGKDTVTHLVWYKHFSDQFWTGDLYPRWVQSMNAGLGSPTFFVYGPWFYFVASLLRPLVASAPPQAHRFLEFDLSMSLALIGSGAAAFVWLRSFTDRSVAVWASIAYMASPYHLWTDFYVRCAVAETWALCWVPLVLYFTHRLQSKKSFSVAGLALSYGMLICTHILTAFVFVAVPVLYFLWMPQARRLRSILRLLFALTLGVALSGLYLFPALDHEKYNSAALLIKEPHYHYANNFLVLDRSLFVWDAVRNQINWYMSWQAADLALVTGLAFWLAWKERGELRGRAAFWAVVSVAAVWMMTPWSAPVWEMSLTLQKIQFPFRFLTILTAASTALLGLGITACRIGLARRSWLAAGLVVLVVLSAAAAYAHVWRMYVKQTMAPESQAELRAGADYQRRVYARWTESSLLTAQGLENTAHRLPRAKLLGQEGQVSVLRWKPRDIAVVVSSPSASWILVRQLYYPRWTANLVPENRSVRVEPSTPEGLIKVEAPPGVHQIRLSLPAGFSEKAGLAASLSSLVLIAFLIAADVKSVRRGLRTPESQETSSAAAEHDLGRFRL